MSALPPKVDMLGVEFDVRFGSEADLSEGIKHVRLPLESGHTQHQHQRPLMTIADISLGRSLTLLLARRREADARILQARPRA
jgi:hypothetical protein